MDFITIDNITTIVLIIGGIILYVAAKIPTVRKQLRIGIFLIVYIKGIMDLLYFKLAHDWRNLSMTVKLDRLKSVYDLIDSFDALIEGDSKEVSELLDKVLGDDEWIKEHS